jgi:putative PIN family toxin of toxin-antitoxin system
MIRVVLDTGVVVSAVISPRGPNAQVFDSITDDKLLPCLSKAVLDEYYRVFSYDRLQHLDRQRIGKLLNLLEKVSVRVRSRRRLELSGDEDDNRVYECAAIAQAGYIITENTKHFKKPYRDTRIVNARQLLALVAPK